MNSPQPMSTWDIKLKVNWIGIVETLQNRGVLNKSKSNDMNNALIAYISGTCPGECASLFFIQFDTHSSYICRYTTWLPRLVVQVGRGLKWIDTRLVFLDTKPTWFVSGGGLELWLDYRSTGLKHLSNSPRGDLNPGTCIFYLLKYELINVRT
jgi:hypothetical protein